VRIGAGCAIFNQKELINRLQTPFKKVHIINGAADDIEKELKRLNDFIDCHGPLYVSVLGISMNGHLGFNEPGINFSWKAHRIPLDKTTQTVMTKYFGNDYHPTRGITQGMA
jgi:glucosamine-6-phosphate deaminase